MSEVQQAVAKQLANIVQRSGKSIAEWTEILQQSGLQKHSQLLALLKNEHGMTHGDANLVVHTAMKTDGASVAEGLSYEELEQAMYVGPKAALLPTHQALMAMLRELGDFDIAPKKGYFSLRRSKQFAMLGPATNSRIELGLNMKNVTATERLLAQAAGGMCQYKIKFTQLSEVDAKVDAQAYAELKHWLQLAYDSAA